MGSGFRTFAASEVLTSSNVQNFLMDQAVTVHSGTAVLATAIPSPEPGMVAYVNSGDASEGLYVHTGSAWLKGPGWNAPWGVVGRALITGPTSATTATTVAGSTITYSQVANRVYKYSVTGHAFWVSVNDGFRCSITNGTGTAYIHHDQLPLGNSTNYGNGFSFNWYELPTASASVTRELRVSRFYGTSGNVQFFADATRIGSLIIEDIGPSGAPA